MNSPIRLLLRAAIVSALPVVSAGCIEAPAPPSEATTAPAPPPPPWERQVEQACRQGGQVDYTHAPVTPDQWGMLADECNRLTGIAADTRLLDTDDLELLKGLPGLRSLRVTGPIDDAALATISQIEGLTILNLPEGRFTDRGLEELQALSRLELLRFASLDVTDAGMKAVAGLKSLRFLHLIGVPITDAGLKPLHGMDHLESFYLDGGNCTDEGLYDLLEALPHLHFHRDQLHLPDDPQAHPHD
jgi:hypothetical protein